MPWYTEKRERGKTEKWESGKEGKQKSGKAGKRENRNVEKRESRKAEKTTYFRKRKGELPVKNTIQNILYQVAKLIDVKSIVTLALVATLVVTTLGGREVPALFSNSVMLVLGFFFGKTNQVTQSDANGANTEKTMTNGSGKEQ